MLSSIVVHALVFIAARNALGVGIQRNLHLANIYTPANRHTHNRCLTHAFINIDDWKAKFDDYICDKFYIFSKGLAINRAKRKWNTFTNFFTRPLYSLAENVNNACKQIAKNRRHAQKSPHALRHKRWLFTYQNKTGFFTFGPEDTFQVEFNNDGTLTTSKGQNGTWKASRGNILLTIPKSQNDSTNIYFTAHLCWNSLGASAYMQRGTIYMDRAPDGWLPKNVLRPVVGRFTAKGIPE